MNKNIIAGGCSFTRGNELSDDTLRKGKSPSNKTWAKGLSDLVQGNYFALQIMALEIVLLQEGYLIT